MASIDHHKLSVRQVKSAKRRAAKKVSVLSIPESYELVVTCRDENDQRQLFVRLAGEGYDCRVLTM
jgi:hypothetical protein